MPRSLARDRLIRHLIDEVDELRSRYNTCTDYSSALAPQHNIPELRNASVPLMGGAAPVDRNSVEGLRSAMNTLAANIKSLTTQMEGVCGAVNKLADSISDLVVALGAVQAPVGMTNPPPVDAAAVVPVTSNSADGSGMRPFSIKVPPCATVTASVRNERRAACSVPPFSVGRFNEGPAAQTCRRSPANQSLRVSGAQQPSLPSFQWQHSSHANSPETSGSSAGAGPVGATPSPLLHCAAATGASDKPLPTPGLFIPDVPVRNPDGGRRPKSESWRDIVKHWNEGDPALGLHTPLKDWHSDWTRGNNRLFASKYQQRSVIALEFIDRFHSDEASFLAAYPEAAQGHCALLRAINAARVERGERESRASQNDQALVSYPDVLETAVMSTGFQIALQKPLQNVWCSSSGEAHIHHMSRFCHRFVIRL